MSSYLDIEGLFETVDNKLAERGYEGGKNRDDHGVFLYWSILIFDAKEL